MILLPFQITIDIMNYQTIWNLYEIHDMLKYAHNIRVFYIQLIVSVVYVAAYVW